MIWIRKSSSMVFAKPRFLCNGGLGVKKAVVFQLLCTNGCLPAANISNTLHSTHCFARLAVPLFLQSLTGKRSTVLCDNPCPGALATGLCRDAGPLAVIFDNSNVDHSWHSQEEPRGSVRVKGACFKLKKRVASGEAQTLSRTVRICHTHQRTIDYPSI
jgi:hypothetical protein